MTANPPSGPSSSSGPWYPPVPSLAASPVDQTKTTPKPAYYKSQFGDDYTGFSYYVRTLNVVIGRNCERVVPPPDQLAPGVPTNPPLRGDDGSPSSSIAGSDVWSQGVGQNSPFGQDIKPTDGLDLSILGNGILDSFAQPPPLPPLDATANLHPDFQLQTEDVKPTIPASPGRAHTTPPESHSHTHLNGDSIAQPPMSAPPTTSNLQLEPESYFDPVFAPPAPPPPPTKKSGPVEHVDVDSGPLKSVSRNHAKIEYHTELGHFCLEIIGRNGAWVDDRYYVKGSTVPSNQGSQIQIATRIFSFILPPSADPSPYSSYGHEDTANASEDVPYPYNSPPGEVGYAEFYGEPGPGPSSVANMMGRIPPAFNVFAGGDGLGMGIEGVDGKVWDDEWDNSDESDSGDDESFGEGEEEGHGDGNANTAAGTVPKVKIRLKGDKAVATPEQPTTGDVEGDGEASGAVKKGSIKDSTKPNLPDDSKPGKGKGGKTTTKATKKKVKAEENTEDSAMDVDPSPAPDSAGAAAAASVQTTPNKAKKDKPSTKKESKKKKNTQPVEIKPNPASAPAAPVVATSADALAEAPAPAPAPVPTPAAPPTSAAAAAPTATPAKPVPNPAQPPVKPPAAANQPPSGAAATPPPAQSKPAQPGQPAKPTPANAQQRPPPAAIPPQLQKATPTTSPAATPTRQNSSSAPPEPPKPFFSTESIETPGRPGHIVVNVPIPPSGAGPRPPPGPLIGSDGKPFIGPPPIKPTATFATIIHRALLFLPRGRGTLGEVCNWVAGEWEWFRSNIDAGWQNSIRHNLSLNKAFLKVPRIPEDDPESKGSVWIIDPEEGPSFEEKQRRDASKSAGKEKNAEVRRERERQKVEERARKQREMALEAHAAHGPHATAHGGNHAKPVSPRPTPIPPRPMQRAQAPTAVSANAKGSLQPKAKISVSIQTLTPAHRAKSVIATTDSSGNPSPFACDGTTLTSDQATFGHLTGDIIDKLTLLGAAGAVDVLSAWVINKNKNQAARAAQQAAAAQASSKPTAASIKAGSTAPRNGAIATPTAGAGGAAAKPIPKKPVAAAPGASGQKFGPAPPGASLTKVIGMIAEVANAKGDVNTVGPNAGALLRYIRVVGVDIDLRVAERIWATGVVPPLPAKKVGPAGGVAGNKPNGTAGAPPRPVNTQGAGGPTASGAAVAKPVTAGQPAQVPRPVATPGPLAPALAPGAGVAPRPPVPAAAAAAAVAPNGPVKRKLEDGAEADDAKKAKVEAAL